MKKTIMTLVGLVIMSATTAFLDWTYAKITETHIKVPIVTPIGTGWQDLTITQRRGRFSNHKYQERVNGK